MFNKQFELRYFEMNHHGEATPLTMLKLLQETAADHCLAIQYSLYDLLKQNIGWVLLSGYMQIARYPKYKETITIRTWLSEYKTYRGIRENVIFDEKGNIIGRGKGLWLFYDIEKRRPARIFDDIQKKWGVNPEESIRHDIRSKIIPLDDAAEIIEFIVRRFDMDTNKHVNNLRYLQWAMESVPEYITDNYYLHSIDGRFVGEAQYGHTIQSLIEPQGDNTSFWHTIKDLGNNRVCSIAKTNWLLRE
ncbi:MAG: acyl-ACP thioesterase domain-containing protein [Balneolales bacterium]